VIVVGAFAESTIEGLLGHRPFPVVIVDGPARPQQFDVIASDNLGGSLVAMEHLLQVGHRRIGMISRLSGASPNFDEREAGYTQAMMEAGLEPVVGRIVDEDVSSALDQVLTQDRGITALFCVNDRFALDVMNAAARLGFQVPNTLSLMGFDNTDHATATEPGLTTMGVDKIGMGRLAIIALDTRIQWPESAPGCLILSPWLISRGTVAPPVIAPIANSSDHIAVR
jgi:LacI family transcriptional regulator